MGSLIRSEEMDMIQLFIQPEAAYHIVSELGEAGIVQFRDLNEELSSFQRKFVNEVKRCDELDRQIKYLEVEEKSENIDLPDVKELPPAPNPREIVNLEAHLEKVEGEIKEMTESAISLNSNLLELTQLKYVLEKTAQFLNPQDENVLNAANRKLSMIEDPLTSARGRLEFFAGVIGRERIHGFEKMLWRISRGNIFLRLTEIEDPLRDPATGHEMLKSVFIVFFQGVQLKSKIIKVCAGFRASLYTVPETLKERQNTLKDVGIRLQDLNMVLNQTKDHRARVLRNVSKELPYWSIMVSKMKAIYHTLNLFNDDVTKKCLIGECWVPSSDIKTVQDILEKGSSLGGSSIPSFLNIIETSRIPPTFNRTNKFTRGFQNLIDSYGVASYREANPALYTIVTFPFLFAVMFGDMGHAAIMTCAGLYLVLAEQKLAKAKGKSEIFDIFFAGRYIILLMGIFSIYTGFIYNDVFSKSLNIFGSSWSMGYTFEEVNNTDFIDLHPGKRYAGQPYFAGIDPVWQGADNKIVFLNSLKMKLSIIIGITHMIFGVIVSVINFVHFRKYSSIFLEFLPQILLLCFLFLWLVVMIFMKWIMYSANNSTKQTGTACAPSVLIYFINMMLFSEGEDKKPCDKYMFEFQPNLQKILVFGSLICIPLMLLGKPLYIMMKKRKSSQEYRDHEDSEEEEEEPISDVFIHQAIHTIEYVLSTVSHTASYLRLWALSLAHAQLSEVLWNMLFRMGFMMPGYLGVPSIVILFFAWSVLTLAILVLMEGLSAFLHTLRLHWVEFMSKFYEGFGYPFQPFYFKTILDDENSED